jgi:hypothetical protein
MRHSNGPYVFNNKDHCPWLGTCVGHHNRRYFLNFLAYSSFGLAEMLSLLTYNRNFIII